MMVHPVVIVIEADTALIVSHPSQHLDGSAFGAVLDDARGGHVYPVRPVLRRVFRVLRWWFGDAGSVAAWTRRWGCTWCIVDARTGHELPGRYTTHAQAVAAEVRFLEAGWGNLQEGQRECA